MARNASHPARNEVRPPAEQAPPPGFKLRHVFPARDGEVTCVAWSPDGRRLASLTQFGVVRIWETATAIKPHSPSADDGLWVALAWLPDGERVEFGAEGGRIERWKISPGERPRFVGEWATPSGLFSVSWSRDSLRASTGMFGAEVHDGASPARSLTHRDWVRDMAWSSVGRIATACDDGIARVWNPDGAEPLLRLEGHTDWILSVAWSPDAQQLATSSEDATIRVWDVGDGSSTTMEGHIGAVTRVVFSADGRLLASLGHDGNARIWGRPSARREPWRALARLPLPSFESAHSRCLAFHPTEPVLVTFGPDAQSLHVWELNVDALLAAGPEDRFVYDVNAKIVLVGESNVGKSCLAMRLAEGRYPDEDERDSTHGLRFWEVSPEQIDPGIAEHPEQRRRIVLWDMGGQDEYRLVHQIFLRDTTLALVFFDPSRGRTAFEEVEAWNLRLEKQLGSQPATKLLVGTKMDRPNDTVDTTAIDQLVARHGFAGYRETSAYNGRGIDALKSVIARHLDWDALGSTSRPELFQRIRDQIDLRRAEGEVVLALEELRAAVRAADPADFSEGAVEAVADQLAKQGVIVDTRLSTGERMLVLRVEEIEAYAGSLIIAARKNPRGVPALEERSLALPNLPLPGLRHRLPRYQEIVVLECVAELLIEHGICFRHEGLLVFPSLFPEGDTSEGREQFPHSVSLYYDFTGAIENIYASLVARLAISREFGEQRLWANRVEFDEPSMGACGLRQVKRKSGLAHIDLYFAESAGQSRRDLFIRFVEDHLRRHGVEVREHQAIKCGNCDDFEISEDIVQENIARGEKDVICPRCRSLTLISEGVERIRQRDSESDRKIFALRTEVEKRTREEADAAKKAVAGAAGRPSGKPARGIPILHLSDLHFTGDVDPKAKLRWLKDDIRNDGGLKLDSLEYLVISGDMTDKGRDEGFEKAREFVRLLNQEFGVSAERCIFVPGNHDVQDREDCYTWARSAEGLRPGTWVQQGKVVLVRDEKRYPERLRTFSDAFFHPIGVRAYPLEPERQGIAYSFWDTGIQFLTLNSCWEIDEWNRKRSGVHPSAVAGVIEDADQQLEQAVKDGRFSPDSKPLRIAVWHHAVAGPEQILNTEFVTHLQNNGVKLALHGDVHEMRRDLVGYWDERSKMHVVGAGSFGSPAAGRPESTPRLYNLLEVSPDLVSVRVHTRCQLKADGAWKGWNEWPRPDGGDGAVPYFDIRFR